MITKAEQLRAVDSWLARDSTGAGVKAWLLV